MNSTPLQAVRLAIYHPDERRHFFDVAYTSVIATAEWLLVYPEDARELLFDYPLRERLDIQELADVIIPPDTAAYVLFDTRTGKYWRDDECIPRVVVDGQPCALARNRQVARIASALCDFALVPRRVTEYDLVVRKSYWKEVNDDETTQQSEPQGTLARPPENDSLARAE